MAYAPLYFEIPTPTYDPDTSPRAADDGSDGSGDDGSSVRVRGLGLSVFGPSNTVYRVTPHPLPPVRWTGPIMAQIPGTPAPANPPAPSAAPPPSTGAEATFVSVGPNQMLNLNTGQIVDGETANNIAQAAATNPSILTAPLSSVPPSLLSAAMKSQLQSGTVATAQSTGIVSGGATSWWTQTTSLFGMTIPHWAFVTGAGGLFLLLSGGGRKGRR